MKNDSQPIAPNAHRLLYAGFMAILAAGVGFSVRGGILGQWAKEFGFTMTELGGITGGGLVGFGLVIILTSLFADKIGYGKIMVTAFVLHFISAVLTLSATYAFQAAGKDAAYYCLVAAMLIFSIGNGLCEAVVNPLTATLFPKAQTHYLNILHAGWPAGLVLGGLASYFMSGQIGTNGEIIKEAVSWKIQMSLFLIPVIIYGVMLLGQKFPKSEAAEAGLDVGQMIKSLAAPLFLFLIVIHAMVGYVELGTDSWISKITGSIMGSPASGLALFVYTSMLMFVLRFVAGPIVHRISPLGLLLVSALLGFAGLQLLGNAATVTACVIAATVYACGKTFLWPTMLAVASERYPKGGAVGIGLLGGVGMLSAGLLGGPAIGFQQDHYASTELRSKSETTFERYRAENQSSFMGMKTTGLDGAKVAALDDDGKEIKRVTELLKAENRTDANHEKLAEWWTNASTTVDADKPLVKEAGVVGGKQALLSTSMVPAIMAGCYLILLIGFRLAGGYKVVRIEESPEALGTAES
ncbi:MFS transporter [Planctomicrobium sp. SH668]|uniref:MFS transporter n=1 Tax=Planctomicrobium sp. SH668 TaxID=3448126 RepID=UPI003F5B8948